MIKYLYGASVQGIQEFIFKTNKLQEIVGASEIVKNISNKFEKAIEGLSVTVLVNAAGNMKAIFENEAECQKVVKSFAKDLMQDAYGITVSQSVIKLQSDKYTQDEMRELIENLKIQRNKPSIDLDSSISLMKLARKTAKPIVSFKNDEELDRASLQKREAYTKWFNEKRKEKEDEKFKELKEISALSNGKNKIAVIHADGNALGKIIQNLDIPLNEFSKELDHATQTAFQNAKKEYMQVREIILGGDDMSVVCNADHALEFTKNFLEEFEKETKIIGGLTACAGIAFCNEKYPFHYAMGLAEELCGVAKKAARAKDETKPPSSLMFHNIQSSNFQSWDKFVVDELTIKNDQQTIRLDFGPYYLDTKYGEQIQDFINTTEAYRCSGTPISRLRNWLSELYKSDESAKQLLDRINDVTEQSGKWNCKIMDKNLQLFNKKLSNDTLIINKDGTMKTPIYDILQIHAVSNPREVN